VYFVIETGIAHQATQIKIEYMLGEHLLRLNISF